MQSTVESARSARENLAGALTVLLTPALTPVFTRIAPSVARATAHLFALERHGDAALGAHAGAARDAVRSALADIQAAGIDSPEVDDAMASIAGALGLSHQLASRAAAPGGTTVSPPAPVAGPASPAAAPAQPAAVVVPAPVVSPAVNVAAPGAAPVRFSSPVSVGAATDPAPQVAPGADAMMTTQLAPSSPPPSSPTPHQVAAAASRTAPKPDDPFFSTQVSRTGRSIAAHPPTAPEAPPLSAPPVAPAPAAHTASAQQAPLAATAMAVSAPVPTVGSLHIPEQIPTAGTADRVGRKDSHRAPLPEKGPAAGALHLEASLGAHSPTNFYKGLSGNDVIDDGGLFIATYQIPAIGTPLWITVSLPGGYEFQAGGVVRWTRSTGSGDSPPGFGAALKDLSKEARQLVYRYVRNREPLFHDDL